MVSAAAHGGAAPRAAVAPGDGGESLAGAARAAAVLEDLAWRTLRAVPDPEIPVISIVDLGIVRHVAAKGDAVEVGLSPTYSGCPATEVIRRDVQTALRDAGIADTRVVDVLSPPWSTDWISEQGRENLREYGIAPPERLGRTAAECPRCRSHQTEQLSEFGSTPCKALHRCKSCLEPFERFKCL